MFHKQISRVKKMEKIILFPICLHQLYFTHMYSYSNNNPWVFFEFEAENSLMGKEGGERRMGMGENSQSGLFSCDI